MPFPINLRSRVDVDAADWGVRVVAAGGTYKDSTLRATSAFARAAKTSGYWSKLNRLNLFCGNQLAACLVPLKVGNGSATETNVGPFVGGDYTEATGLTGNSSTKYLNTGLTASTGLTVQNTHLAVYNRSSTVAAGGNAIGCNDGGGNGFSLWAPFTDGNFDSDQYGAAAGRVTVVSTTPYGFLVGSRTTIAAHALYRNGASIGSNATAEGALPAFPLFVFAGNNAGAPTALCAFPLGGYSIGTGLTAAEVAAYNTHMQAFQVALGRNV